MEQESYGYNPSKLLIIKEVMDMLQISRSSLFNYRTQGRIKSIELGGRIKFRLRDIEEFLLKNTVEKLVPRKRKGEEKVIL